MTTKPLKRPRDPIALAKFIGDIATGQVEDILPLPAFFPSNCEFVRIGNSAAVEALDK
jgi:hypothetical protein